MNVLLTGGTGYIGSHAAVVLLDAGYNVVLVDNLINSKADVAVKVSEITGVNVPFVQGDIRDTSLLCSILKEHKINSVIHFAGLKAVGESVEKPLDYYSNNVQGTISLLEAMNEIGVRQLVFSSSATVYGQPQYLPIDEQHPTNATNPYGRTKLHIEEMLRDLANSSKEWRIACLRYFNPVGAHNSTKIGEAPNGVPNNLMPYIAQVAAGLRPHLNVFGDDYETPDGTGIRDYIHVMDLAEGHLAALKFLTSHSGWHAINLGTGNGYSVLDMVLAFERTVGRSIAYIVRDRRPGDVASCYADTRVAAQLLNWRATRGLPDMCDSAWRWQNQ